MPVLRRLICVTDEALGGRSPLFQVQLAAGLTNGMVGEGCSVMRPRRPCHRRES